MTNSSYLFPLVDAAAIMRNRFKDCECDSIVKFSDPVLSGWSFSTELNEKAYLVAIHSQATTSDFNWILPAEPNQNYFRLVVSTNYVWGVTNADEQEIKIKKGNIEHFLVLVFPQNLLNKYIDDWQFHELVAYFRKPSSAYIDYDTELQVFFQQVGSSNQKLKTTAQAIFDAFLIKLMQFCILKSNQSFKISTTGFLNSKWNLFRAN